MKWREVLAAVAAGLALAMTAGASPAAAQGADQAAAFERDCGRGTLRDCLMLAERLLFFDDVDRPRALGLLRPACNVERSGRACNMLAFMPELGLEERMSAAARACELGADTACLSLGYWRGDLPGGNFEAPVDPAAARRVVTDRQAFALYERACFLESQPPSADRGIIDSGWACYVLAQFYRRDWPHPSRFVTADSARYRELRRRACEIGGMFMDEAGPGSPCWLQDLNTLQ